MDEAAAPVRLLVASQSILGDAIAHSDLGWLTSSEHDRLAQLHAPRRRDEFLACRYALRLMLAGDANPNPNAISAWQLDAPSGSAPHLNVDFHGAAEASRHQLSLSHSGDYLACSVAPGPIGVDIEILNRKPASRLSELAAMACTPTERERLAAIADDTLRHLRFVQLWSLKEAWFKQVGTGVDFALLPQLECRLASDDVDGVDRSTAPERVGHAQSWIAQTATAQHAVLSVCCGTSFAADLRNESGLDWQDAGRWTLHLMA